MKLWAAAALAAAASLFEAGAVTPVEKVVELIVKLQAQVEQEGKDEAAAYDKYACFCKEQVDEKLYSIEKSAAKLEKLSAKIDKLSSEITTLNGEISDLGNNIDALVTAMATAKGQRDAEHATFLVEQADLDGALGACRGAVASLTASKGALAGKAQLEAAFVQMQAVAVSVGAEEEVGQLNAIMAAGQTPASYKYHANDIMTTIESLLAKFTRKKNEVEQEEFDVNSAFEKRQLSMANEKKLAEQDQLEKSALGEEKGAAKSAADADKDKETADKAADQNLQNVLVEECETKAKLWDQRSQTRADELRAMNEAVTSLKEGAAPNYKANKKLVGLSQVSKQEEAPKSHWVYVEETVVAQPASFLQLRRGARGAKASVLAKVRDLLSRSADALSSPVLSAAVMKVTLAEDHFVKVRQIIKDLVARLQSEADSERTQKAFCDEATVKAVETRDSEQSTSEDLDAKITSKESDKAQLHQDIATLSGQVAENKKALLEASELRDVESKENQKTLVEAAAGRDAVKKALQILKKFYEGAALVQQRSGSLLANSGWEAPDVFDAEYQGSQEASKGIVGMLEVVLSDFRRTVATVASEESDAAEAFGTFRAESEKDTAAKQGAAKGKEGEVADIEDALMFLQDGLTWAKRGHAEALKELDKLHSMCVAGEETYEERVAKREKEIAALKDAHDMLENWQS
eukprot:CAMPEP_0203893938 /NCGR_PEP_ID=MMETSP0359-20131031/36947_1 /ASSEMBLY_ACC=CAM_ASM_000338 /TAXON_ID=268821 /ORGANISM="Scrippsiella Hangoei, Strain SHTV-5" /LENGTH=691 /DNA_ID=CAMNT_0050816181 /DNA_START=5 /DNA_END=2080 /DNA_ORIENTATION=+